MNLPVSTQDKIVQDILKALDLKDKKVISLNIEMKYDKPVSIKVERLLTRDQALEMRNVLETYNIKLVKENQEEEHNALDSW